MGTRVPKYLSLVRASNARRRLGSVKLRFLTKGIFHYSFPRVANNLNNSLAQYTADTTLLPNAPQDGLTHDEITRFSIVYRYLESFLSLHCAHLCAKLPLSLSLPPDLLLWLHRHAAEVSIVLCIRTMSLAFDIPMHFHHLPIPRSFSISQTPVSLAANILPPGLHRD